MARFRRRYAHDTNLRGKVGNFIYKWYGNRVVITTLPRPSRKPPTAKKKAVCKRFAQASKYAVLARENRDLWQAYAAEAKKRRIPARALAISDYLTSPKIKRVCLGHLSPKCTVKVWMGDTFTEKTTAISVVLRSSDGAVLANGLAEAAGKQYWEFVSPLDRNSLPAIEVTATDRFKRKVVARFTSRLDSQGAPEAVPA